MKSGRTVATADKRTLLDWVNSLDPPSCALASGLEDLQKGEVLLDIASLATGRAVPPGVRRKPPGAKLTLGDAISNLGLMMREFAPLLPAELRIKPVDLIENEEALYGIVRFWREMYGKKGARVMADSPSKVPALNLKLIHRQHNSTAATPAKAQKSPAKSQTTPLVPSARKSSFTPTTPIKRETPVIRVSLAGDAGKPRPSQFPTVPQSERTVLFQWVLSLRVLPKATELGEFLSLFSSGVALCDIVNRLEGKKDPIQGVERCPRNRTAALANVTKALKVLRGIHHMRAMYLWSTQEILQGDEDVIWGLISDIKSFYQPASSHSPHRPTTPINTYQSARASQCSPKSATSTTHLRSLSLESTRSFGQSLSRESVTTLPQPPAREMETDVRAWLDSLKLSHLLGYAGKHFLEDPVKNGVLMCEVVGKLEPTEPLKVVRKPKTVAEARQNVEEAIRIIREKRPEMPSALLRLREKLIQGNSKSCWALLWTLSRVYSALGRPVPQPTCDSLYPPALMRRLDHSLAVWIHSLGVSQCQVCPQSVLDLLPGVKSGVLLCDLVSKVLKIPVNGVSLNSRGEVTSLSNIKKALEPLRVHSAMCQEFVWRDRELYYGDLESVYGLLEDLRRLHDQMPARKPGTRGKIPYLGLISPSEQVPPPAKRSRHKSSLSASIVTEQSADQPTVASMLRKFRVNPVPETAENHHRTDVAVEFTSDLKRIFQTFEGTMAKSTWEERDEAWLERWLSQVGVDCPSPLSVSQLRNGVILCQTIERLSKAAVIGFTEYPKTTAAALNNIRKALEVLRKRPKFPKEYFFVEEDVLKGNSTVTLGLFSAIRSSFRCWEKRQPLTTRDSSEKSFQTRLSAFLS